MSDRDAIWAAVLDRPFDDTPRGVLADWEGDHGNPKEADRIRWFLARPEYRQANPIQSAIPEWPEEDRGRADPSCVCNRAFISEVRLPLAAFLEHAVRLFQTMPITRVVLTDVPIEADGPYWLFGDPDPDDPAKIAHVMNRTWNSRDAALTALSDACVAYGRALAGLRPLPPTHATPAP